ncbi:MAG: Flp family type IVb pilin [Planctomycetota bacterium]|nr:Flp family type IVb pilin [Planctomycetota bacterium]MDA1213187.1 Flp family type IVb pilin [Planctomycetota bacterium]
MSFWRNLLNEESGPTAVEYAVMLALILMSVITAVSAVGSGSGGMWGNVDTQLDAAGLGG